MILRQALRRLGAVGLLILAAAGCSKSVEPDRPDIPRRIVAIAPSLTEVLFELGLGERVVGVGDYSRWPPEAATKTRIGGLFDPRLEQIAALDPDLAVLLPSEEELAVQLGQLGIDVLTIPSETIDDVRGAFIAIAERCEVPERGFEALGEWEAGLRDDPLPEAPTVALIIGREPGALDRILVAGPGSFLDELLGRTGARNVFADSPVAYAQIGIDELMQRSPDLLVELQGEPVAAQLLLRDWEAFPRLASAAVSCRTVIAGDHVLLPGPRLPRLYAELRKRIVSCLEET